jgi:hypothetical protein
VSEYFSGQVLPGTKVMFSNFPGVEFVNNSDKSVYLNAIKISSEPWIESFSMDEIASLPVLPWSEFFPQPLDAKTHADDNASTNPHG